MSPAEKGERYARIFRKAGALIGKASIARAIKTLKEGAALAEELGDGAMLGRFEDEIARISKPSEEGPTAPRRSATTSRGKDGSLPD
jgi:hypothetical protein